MRNNSFDLIRHIAAFMVLVSHHFALSGMDEPGIAGYNSLGGIAVIAFFSISGLLITQSYINSRSFGDYISKRCARIFPALILCAFVMTYIGGGLFAEGYAGSSTAFIDFLRISLFGRANIEQVTGGFIFSESFNGSLWTLKIEFGFYLLLALALVIYRRALTPWILLAAFSLATYVLGNYGSGPLTKKLALYSAAGVAFFAGAVIALHKHHFNDKRVLALTLVAGMGLVLTSIGTSMAGMLATLGFCLATVSLGLIYVDQTIRGRFDISYGVYLYAFPVQQVIINKTSLGFVPSMLVSAVVVIVLAIVSWRLVERPALQFVHRRQQGHALQKETES